MTVSLDEFIGSLPQAEQTAIARRADELRAEVATLKALRTLLADTPS